MESLLLKLKQLDKRLIDIWLDEDSFLSDDDRWEIFVVLLETRVELLQTCKDAGVKLTPTMCLPSWLERLVSRKKEIRLRELKLLSEGIKARKIIEAYEKSATTDAPSKELFDEPGL